MQCLARAVARSARGAAEGYAGRRFVATTGGGDAARSYANRQMRLAAARALRERTRSERLYQQRLRSELRAVGAQVGKLEDSLGADMGRRLCAIIAGILIAGIFERSVGSAKKK